MAAIAEAIGWLNFPLITEIGSRGSTFGSVLAAVPCQPDALVGPALAADAAVHVRGSGAVLEVVPASCRQGGIQLL
jgi:hypothetical protein